MVPRHPGVVAGSDIGRASAQRLAGEGAAVLVTDFNDDSGNAVAQSITEDLGKARFVHHDVTSPSDWKSAVAAAIEHFGGCTSW